MSDLSIIEQFAVEQAVYSALGRDVKTGVAHNLRGEVDAYYHDQHTHTGADRFRVAINGVPAGTYRFDQTASKKELVVTDMDALLAWDDNDFLDFCSRWINDHIGKLASEFFRATGAVPDGTEVQASPEGVKGVYVPDKALVEHVREQLASNVAGLLEGGN